MTATTTCEYGGIIDKDPSGILGLWDFSTSTCVQINDNATGSPFYMNEVAGQSSTTIEFAQQLTLTDAVMFVLLFIVIVICFGTLSYKLT